MAIKTVKIFIERLCRTARELRAANGANVTVTFALATLPMVGFVGAAVDYSHANSVKAAMQAAADSTALMLSKNAATITNSALQTQANSYFKALFTRPEATGLTVSAVFTADTGNKVVVNASSNVPTNFMGLMGFSQLKVAVDSQVAWGNTRLRVALVLDTTGSMADDGKMTALKSATKSLLDQLKAAAVNPGDVYVSIVPFSKDVNVGKSNYQANWINWTDFDQDNGDCSKNSYDNDKAGCIAAGKTWTGANHNTWTGCVVDRGGANSPGTGNYDTNVVAPSTSNTSTLFMAEQYSSCSPKIVPLNYVWQDMKDFVDTFYPAGNTNQAIGLAHGWMSLVGGGPYPAPPAEDPKYQYTKVIILLTDGLNTQDRWYTSQSSIDAREKLTCDNINAAAIQLYTIQVNTGGDPTSTLLKNCAGSSGKYPDADKFFLLTSANQIVATFQQIGTRLSNLRIAQ